ncbi:ABC transporter substrate-binding protein [Bifidobacterium aerophilum]|uniref:Extracellular solute-binding protein n=1 Tax=Bifidobacterium aerophilum TaxID=1798155 RepID=A0A6N9Z7B0_9BIFI|nr:extracellular solute-binding protein [Bifidobacterium aerophilum]NEG90015.1 extracellular solute-binding protein [Bifidobacterium aerophilum]
MARKGNWKRTVAIVAVAASVTSIAACGETSADGEKGQVYYLNSKPEVVEQFEELAQAYTAETGVKVDVQTATSDKYESSLTSELGKSNAPTMFNVSGYPSFAKVKQYLEPMQDTEIYGLLTDEGKSVVMSEGDNAYTVPFVAEYDGIIYNKKLVGEYAQKDYAVIDSIDDIVNYDVLKQVVEDMNAHKDDLGIVASFASPGLDTSGSWRFDDHMARIPVAAELRDEGKTFAPEITGKYLPQYKDFFDLQANNSPTDPKMLGSKINDDVVAEFALGQVAFLTNGSWTYTQIKDSEVADEDIGMLPFWMGIPGEEKYSVVAFYENQWGVNKKASAKDKQATLDFMKWMISSDKGKEVMAKEMGFAVPYSTFGANDKPDNPLIIDAQSYETKGKKMIYNILVPDQEWKNGICGALTNYVQGTGDWEAVRSAFVDGWKTEWANNEAVLGGLPESKTLE